MEMRRKDRAQGKEFAYALIDRCTHGVMALSTGEDTPYCVPLSFARKGDSLYFHCAREGRKVELLRRNPRVCVTFVGEDSPVFTPPAMYSTWFQSAIAAGTAVEVTEDSEKVAALRAICEKMTPTHMGEGFDRAVERSLHATAVWRIDLDEVSGKAKLRKP